MASTNPELITLSEWAQMTRRSLDAVYAERARGRGPRAVKLGKRLLIPRAEAERYIAAHLEEAPEYSRCGHAGRTHHVRRQKPVGR
jgi:predicted DNA-binding transcriptional regulator AlpA